MLKDDLNTILTITIQKWANAVFCGGMEQTDRLELLAPELQTIISGHRARSWPQQTRQTSTPWDYMYRNSRPTKSLMITDRRLVSAVNNVLWVWNTIPRRIHRGDLEVDTYTWPHGRGVVRCTQEKVCGQNSTRLKTIPSEATPVFGQQKEASEVQFERFWPLKSSALLIPE